MTEIDVAVVGGGVAGLASALAVAEGGASVCLLERHVRLGHETSTRNSGVIHAGIYYPPGSLKAALCVEGKDRLYAFAARHGVPHDRCGKLIWLKCITHCYRQCALNRFGRIRMATCLPPRSLLLHTAAPGLTNRLTGIATWSAHGRAIEQWK